MNLSPDDPKLTAYVLGELDKAEAAAIEQELKQSSELRQAVEEIRATAEFIKSEFATEEKLSLSAQQKQTIAAKLPPTNVIPMPKRKIGVFISISAIAASVMFILAWGLWVAPKGSQLATNSSSYKYAQNAEQARRNELEKQKNITTEAVPAPVVQPPAVQSTAPPVTRPKLAKNSTKVDVSKKFAEPTKREEVPALTVQSKLAQRSHEDSKAFGFEDEPGGVKTGNRVLTEDYAHGSTPGARATPSTPADVSVNGSLATPLPSSGSSGLYGLSGGKQNGGNVSGIIPPARTAPSQYALADSSVEKPQIASSEDLYRREGKKSASKHRAVGVTDVPARKRTSISASVRGFYDDNYSADEVRTRGGHFESFTAPSPQYAQYPQYVENSFESVLNAPLSTLSVDVDTASYANVRHFLNQRQMPPKDSVRVEEMINYFTYNYPQPRGNEPFSVNMEVAGCPWNKEHRLVRVGLKGKEIAQDKRPPSNFVFLIDVSGSMSPSERLPLIKQALRMLVKKMTENDRIGIVVYAGNAGVVLESTSCVNKETILEALDRLEAGGSTNGGDGIEKAYALAEENFIKGGVNRVILATDGDFNVGISDQNALVNLIQKKAKSGVFLSALGVGTDNYKDALMQKLADKGNGNYHYLDTLEEAQKVLIQQMNGTLVTIAKDVKIQIEFNPAQVQSYRLIGYEKRVMEAQDFNNDKKDAGEIGAGHTVTALYEIVPTGVDEDSSRPAVDDLKYQSKPLRKTPKTERREPRTDDSNELLTLKLRYKKPDGDTSKLIEFPLHDAGNKFSNATTDFRFASAVASFGMLLKDSEYHGNFNYDRVRELAESAKGDDKEGYRAEFINLVKKAKSLERSRE